MNVRCLAASLAASAASDAKRRRGLVERPVALGHRSGRRARRGRSRLHARAASRSMAAFSSRRTSSDWSAGRFGSKDDHVLVVPDERKHADVGGGVRASRARRAFTSYSMSSVAAQQLRPGRANGRIRRQRALRSIAGGPSSSRDSPSTAHVAESAYRHERSGAHRAVSRFLNQGSRALRERTARASERDSHSKRHRSASILSTSSNAGPMSLGRSRLQRRARRSADVTGEPSWNLALPA